MKSTNFAPEFIIGAAGQATRSFRQILWKELLTGQIQIGSSNRTNAIVPLSHLNSRILEKALSLLIEAFPVLNCHVEDRAGDPWLIQNDQHSPQLTVFEAKDENIAADLVGNFVWRSFDLGRAPLYRVYAIKVGTAVYLGMIVHHFISDGIAIGLLIRALQDIYRQLCARRYSPLPAQLSYGDYLNAINLWIDSDAARYQRDVELRHVSGMADLDLSERIDCAGPAEERFEVDEAIASQARKLAREQNVTLFTLLLTVQKTLMLSYSGGQEVGVKIITSGRDTTPLFTVAGNLTDRRHIITNLTRELPFFEAMERTQKSLARGRRNPFVRDDFLQADLAASGISKRAPMFNFSSAPLKARTEPQRIRSGEFVVPPPPPGTPVTRPRDHYYLFLHDNGQSLSGKVQYETGSLIGFVSAFERCLRSACAAPNTSLRGLINTAWLE